MPPSIPFEKLTKCSPLVRIIGKVCWRAWQGYGSVLFFDFGEPSAYVSDRVTRFGRPAGVRGDSGFVIEHCDWYGLACGQPVADSEATRDEIRSALSFIRGQVLIDVSSTKSGQVLDFDLGGKITMRPYRDSIRWPAATTSMWRAYSGLFAINCMSNGTIRVSRR